MLDLSHPMTKHVFRASGLMDAVMGRGQQMSVSPSAVRAKLLAECLPLFAEMRELALARFGKRAGYIMVAVDEYEVAIRAIGGLGEGRITEDRGTAKVVAPSVAPRSPSSARSPTAKDSRTFGSFCAESATSRL